MRIYLAMVFGFAMGLLHPTLRPDEGEEMRALQTELTAMRHTLDEAIAIEILRANSMLQDTGTDAVRELCETWMRRDGH